MSANKTRNGPALHATVTTAGVINTSAEESQFIFASGADAYCRPAVIHNNHATVDAYIKVNATGATASDFDFKVGPDEYLDTSLGNVINVETISVYMATGGAFADVRTFGWNPTGGL